jgi:hypothetical protein
MSLLAATNPQKKKMVTKVPKAPIGGSLPVCHSYCISDQNTIKSLINLPF